MAKKLILILSLLVSLALHAQNDYKYNLLWKIEGNGLSQASYLFGTMHIKDVRGFHFSDSVMPAISRCSAFAMELHPDSMIAGLYNEFFGNDTIKSIKEILGDQDYKKLNKKFEEEHGYSIDQLNLKNPLMLKAMLYPKQKKSEEKETFVDGYLMGIAKTYGKNIYGLEKVNEQLNIFYNATKEQQKKNLMDIVENEDKSNEKKLDDLIEKYQKGNINNIVETISEFDFDRLNINDRNRIMVNSMLTLMKKQSLFTAVGVAHLPGPDGIIDLLKYKGYKVTPVQASFTGIAENFHIDYSKMNWVANTDSILGYTVDAPGKLIPVKIFQGLNTIFYTDLTNNVNYGTYTINLQNSKEKEDENVFINNILKNYKNSKTTQIIQNKKINKNGYSGVDLIIKTNNSIYLRMQFFNHHKMLYCLFMGNKLEQLNTTYANRFFNSFKTFESTKTKNSNWVKYKSEKGAFSVNFPLEPQPIVKEIKNEAQENEEPQIYTINMLMATDYGNMTNYLLRYNDYPIGSYIENKARIFDASIQELKNAGELVSTIDTIWQEGNEGREFNILLKQKYLTQIRIFIRGNRTYMLMKQNLNEKKSDFISDEYFSSFTFEPYQKTTNYLLKPEGANFEILMPSNPKIKNDTIKDYESNYENIHVCFANNQASGGLYHFEYMDFNPYFQLRNKDSFYNEFINNTLNFGDSVISSETVKINEIEAKEFQLFKWNADNQQRARIWIANNQLYYLTAYIGKDELMSEENELIYNSFRIIGKPQPEINLYSSKTSQILNGLLQSDSITYKKALGALSFYKFSDNDLPKIYEILNKNFVDDTLSSGARSLLMNSIAATKNVAAIDKLVALYPTIQNLHELKGSLLNAIVKIDKIKGLPNYLRLLKTGNSIILDDNNWKILSPLNDSIEFARNNFDQLICFVDSSAYKKNILTLANRITLKDSVDHPFLNKYFEQLCKNCFEDLNQYELKINAQNDKDEENEYYYPSEIYNYLSFMENYKAVSLTDNFTTALLNKNNSNDLKITALEVRIRKNLPVNQSMIDEELKNNSSCFRLLKAYNDINQLNHISTKYTSAQAYSKLCLYEYLIDNEEIGIKINSIGTLDKNDSNYYVYSYKTGNEDDNKEYIGIVGPFAKKNPKYQFNYDVVICNWSILEKDWKKQAKEMIETW